MENNNFENIGHVEVPRKFNSPEDVLAMYGPDIRKKVAEGMNIHDAAPTILEKDMHPYNEEDEMMVMQALEQLRQEIDPTALPFMVEIDPNAHAQNKAESTSSEDLPLAPTEENIVI